MSPVRAVTVVWPIGFSIVPVRTTSGAFAPVSGFVFAMATTVGTGARFTSKVSATAIDCRSTHGSFPPAGLMLPTYRSFVDLLVIVTESNVSLNWNNGRSPVAPESPPVMMADRIST